MGWRRKTLPIRCRDPIRCRREPRTAQNDHCLTGFGCALDRREIVLKPPLMKFVAMIHPLTLERQVQALRVDIDAPDMQEAIRVLAKIWWAPELEGIHGVN